MPGSLAAVAGIGMRSSELLAAPGKTTRGASRFGARGSKLSPRPGVGGLDSFFLFFSVFFSVSLFDLLLKIARHFIKCPKFLCGLEMHIASHL